LSAASIARTLGGTGQSRSGWYSCNCPVCCGEAKLGIKDVVGGLAVNCFKLCRRTDILAELERLRLLNGELGEPEDPHQAAQRRAPRKRRRHAAGSLRPATSSPTNACPGTQPARSHDIFAAA
jgi:hypothetical protein